LSAAAVAVASTWYGGQDGYDSSGDGRGRITRRISIAHRAAHCARASRTSRINRADAQKPRTHIACSARITARCISSLRALPRCALYCALRAASGRKRAACRSLISLRAPRKTRRACAPPASLALTPRAAGVAISRLGREQLYGGKIIANGAGAMTWHAAWPGMWRRRQIKYRRHQ